MLTLVAMKIRPIFAIFAITAILADFAVRAEVGSADSKLELVSEELNHLVAILYIYAGGFIFMK